MSESVVLVTGCSGEVGHGLLEQLSSQSEQQIIAIDRREINPGSRASFRNVTFMRGDIRDRGFLATLQRNYSIDSVFHLAALLSTAAERDPFRACEVNVMGTMNLLEIAVAQAELRAQAVKFVFPSSIAAQGFSPAEKAECHHAVSEDDYLHPITVYGLNKLSIEGLGEYFSSRYRNGALSSEQRVDFRSVRFPGLLSAKTLPTGGTSDFGPEMLHAAAQGKPYSCFVPPEARIPFMVMPDAIKALLDLHAADAQRLSKRVYNVSSFSLSAKEIEEVVRSAFPNAQVEYEPDNRRTEIIESWPEEIDDSRARQDWGWAPEFDKRRAFEEYLIPGVNERYKLSNPSVPRCCNG